MNCGLRSIITPTELYNQGNWQVAHGWFESDSVGDIRPGDVAYLHMGGGFTDIFCSADFLLEGDNHTTWFQWWYSAQDGKAARMNCGSERSHYDNDGRIIRFYVGW